MKWEEMTRAQRRVAVAKDVIKAVKAKKFNVLAFNAYIEGDMPIEAGRERQWAKTSLKQARCTVCARGGMMLCKVAKYNNFEIPSESSGLYAGGAETTLALSDCFTEKQLLDIEHAFENCWCDIEDDADRLTAIMQNIIDHNGTFKPSVQYVMS